jgi:hypothetical protein
MCEVPRVSPARGPRIVLRCRKAALVRFRRAGGRLLRPGIPARRWRLSGRDPLPPLWGCRGTRPASGGALGRRLPQGWRRRPLCLPAPRRPPIHPHPGVARPFTGTGRKGALPPAYSGETRRRPFACATWRSPVRNPVLLCAGPGLLDSTPKGRCATQSGSPGASCVRRGTPTSMPHESTIHLTGIPIPLSVRSRRRLPLPGCYLPPGRPPRLPQPTGPVQHQPDGDQQEVVTCSWMSGVWAWSAPPATRQERTDRAVIRNSRTTFPPLNSGPARGRRHGVAAFHREAG